MATIQDTETGIMNIDEARQIMPLATESMSDDEVLRLIERLELLAGAVIEMVQKTEYYSE